MSLRQSVYLNDRSEEIITSRGDGISGTVNKILAQYQTIIDRTELPRFTEREIKIMTKELIRHVDGPAQMIDQIEDTIWDEFVDDLTGKISGHVESLHLKIKGLDYVQKVVLLERMRARQ